MDAREFKAKIGRKEIVLGTWSHIPSVQVVEVVGASGMDFIVFDLEHGPHCFTEMPGLYAAAEGAGLVPLARVPGLECSSVLRCLDSGAKGIVVPHVDSAEKGRRSLRSMYYGDSSDSRGIATLTRSSRFDAGNERTHIRSQNDLVTSVLMVEDRAALDELEAICALPALDVVFVGVYDLSQSLGLGGDLEDARLLAAFEDAVRRIRSSGAAVGCYASDPAGARRLVDLGVTFVTLSVDGAMLRRSYDSAVEQLAGVR